MIISLDLLTGGIKLVGEPGVGNIVLQCNTSLPINNFCAREKINYFYFFDLEIRFFSLFIDNYFSNDNSLPTLGRN